MLEAIREHAQGWIARIILGLIIVSFAIWGLEGYLSGDGKEPAVATVGDSEISQSEFSDALKQQREALGIPPDQAGEVDSQLRKSVLDQLINMRLLVNAADENGFTISEAQLNAFQAGIEIFQDNGQFSKERLDAWLASRGLQEKDFRHMLRQDILLRQLQFAQGEGAVVPMLAAERFGKLLAQQREVNEVIYDRRAFLKLIQIDDQAVEKEYNARKQDYAVPAQVRLQYLMLSPETMRGQTAPDEAAIRQYYESSKARYQEPETRKASHILVRLTPDMDAAAREAARTKAEKLLQGVRQAPASFAAVARKSSDDPGSAERGGDLGAFTREMMVKPFADAAFEMKVGEISGLVETGFGYHIIRLDGVTPARQIPLETVKAEIAAELQNQTTARHFAEAAEQFSNLVYEQPDGLDAVAKTFHLEVQESGWISRGRAEPAFLNHARLMDAVFASESIEKRQNTEAIEVGPNRLVAARVLEYRPASSRPLAEVAEAIRFKLAFQAAGKKAVEAGEQALAAARNGQAPAGMSAPMGVSRMRALNLPPAAIKAIFKAETKQLPAWVGAETEDGYRLYRINRVSEEELTADQVQEIRRDLQRLMAQEEVQAYLASLRARTKVKTHQETLGQKLD